MTTYLHPVQFRNDKTFKRFIRIKVIFLFPTFIIFFLHTPRNPRIQYDETFLIFSPRFFLHASRNRSLIILLYIHEIAFALDRVLFFPFSLPSFLPSFLFFFTSGRLLPFNAARRYYRSSSPFHGG